MKKDWSDTDSDENDENDRNHGNVHSSSPSSKDSKRSLSSLCRTEDIEEEILMMKLNHLVDEPEGIHALQWLIVRCFRTGDEYDQH